MNRDLRRLFVLALLIFFVLMAGTARWTAFESGDLKADRRNHREQIRTAGVPRGTIRASDGTVLAKSLQQQDGTYERRYTQSARDASQLIGYAYADAGLTGMEQEHNDELTGKVRSAATLLSAMRGDNERGDDIVATLDPAVQTAALNGFAGRKGAAIAIDVRNGAVRAMASFPNYDLNAMNHKAGREQVLSDHLNSPSLNRVTQGLYPPGSTFKVITTSAALGTGKYTPQTPVDGRSPLSAQGQSLRNFHDEQFGSTTLTFALTHSINTAFARLAEDIGPGPISKAMTEFGFGSVPLIDYPKDQLLPSGVRATATGKLLPVDGDVDIARVAIGQERLLATPLEMGLVAATIARRGDKPRLSTIQEVTDPEGRTLSSLGKGRSAGRAISARDAADLTTMMEQVVVEGTGAEAELAGLRVAGKTGSAEVGAAGADEVQPWFIGFAPADRPQIAVAVTLEKIIGGQGGVDAAPIAKAMMQAAL